MEAKERLTKKLESITKEYKNLESLKNYFGEENLKKLPFKSLKIDGLYENSWDGSHTLDVNLTTGRVHQYCTVADVGDILITNNDLKLIEEAIHKKLDAL